MNCSYGNGDGDDGDHSESGLGNGGNSDGGVCWRNPTMVELMYVKQSRRLGSASYTLSANHVCFRPHAFNVFRSISKFHSLVAFLTIFGSLDRPCGALSAA